MLNYLENESIQVTNNRVENYYRTTLLGCQKRIYRTLDRLKRRTRETNTMDTQKHTKAKHATQLPNHIQLKKNNIKFNSN